MLDIVMAVELTEEQISKCFEEASSDLKFLFDKDGGRQVDPGEVVRGRGAHGEAASGLVQGRG